jgi:protein gp37
MELSWVRSVRNQCIDQKVPFFFKQWGGFRPKAGGRELDGREWSEFPELSKSGLNPQKLYEMAE